MHKYRRKAIYFLIGYLIVFAIILMATLWSEKKGVPIIDIGMPYSILNWAIIIMSFFGIFKVVKEIADIESHHEYENRMRSKSV
jgi:hypothetical protein